MTTTKDSATTAEPQKITANEITIVDAKGKPRIRMLVEEDGTAAVEFLDRDERLRMALYLKEYDVDDEEYEFGADSDNDAGLVVKGRQSKASIMLGISNDGFFERRARLEILDGPGWGSGRHRFPARPPNVSD